MLSFAPALCLRVPEVVAKLFISESLQGSAMTSAARKILMSRFQREGEIVFEDGLTSI
jgi:hypothetical protein